MLKERLSPAQRARYLSRGWSACRAADMNAVFAALAEADPEALRRACRLEIFDEFEEWTLIMSHYCVSYGVNDDVSDGFLVDFNL